jgi:hypothetical protein
VVDLDAPLGEQLLDVAVGQAEVQVPADRDDDHLGRETEAGKADCGRGAGRGRRVLMREVPLLKAVMANTTAPPQVWPRIGWGR